MTSYSFMFAGTDGHARWIYQGVNLYSKARPAAKLKSVMSDYFGIDGKKGSSKTRFYLDTSFSAQLPPQEVHVAARVQLEADLQSITSKVRRM